MGTIAYEWVRTNGYDWVRMGGFEMGILARRGLPYSTHSLFGWLGNVHPGQAMTVV